MTRAVFMHGDRAALKSRTRAFAFAPDGAPPQFEIRNAAGDGGGPAEILLYDEIGYFGVTAKAFVQQLAAITAPSIHLRVNSPGGDVFEGMAMFNALRRHPATKLATIDGLAASMGSLVPLAADRVEIAASAMFMIHEPWGIGLGSADEMRALADLLDKISGQSAGIYIARTGNEADQVAAWMKAETWFAGSEAVAAGFADALVEDPKDAKALSRWDLRAFANPPAAPGGDPADETPPAPGRPHLRSLRREIDLARLRG